MTVQEIKNFLIMVLNKEMEEEYRTTDNKDYIKDCIEAKKWLLDKKNIMKIVALATIQDDIDKYLKD